MVLYQLALEDAKRRLQLEYFRHYVHDVSAPYGDLRVELYNDYGYLGFNHGD